MIYDYANVIKKKYMLLSWFEINCVNLQRN